MRPFRVLPDWRLDDLAILAAPCQAAAWYISISTMSLSFRDGQPSLARGDKLPMRQFCPHPALLHVDPFEPIIDEDLAPGDILHSTDSCTTASHTKPR